MYVCVYVFVYVYAYGDTHMYMYVYVHVQMYVYNVYVHMVSYHGLVESLAGTSIHNAWSVDVDDLSAIFHGNACNAACVLHISIQVVFCGSPFRCCFVHLNSGVSYTY